MSNDANRSESFPPNFLVSNRIVKLWKRGILSFTPHVLWPVHFFTLHRRGANAELRTELAHLVFSTLISEFRFMRHGVAEPQQLPLFGAGGVFEKLTPRFAETAMVKDTDVPEFLLLLEQELKSHLLKRPMISGQWGTLAALDGEIIVRLTACDKLDGDRSSVTSRTLNIVL